MAAQGHGNKGSMDITQNRETWEGFLKVVKWSLIAIAVIMIGLALFRT